ncbi:class I SAM-dependent methyltransferase [Desulforamulus hydrothermalis]|uniref:SAM-dependent methyltransferase n=1 Tax=Desulforamulus hydrothermalis Lam5 = DSM 18033 TaxID=1121428 RepID=K8E0Z7_9FIRM|nr:class I SAM-dependent methyltransferase [Desulforamulus hydrothermalis]CCO09347.1 conserved hypothetical protein [Desulforamulus hydrothermalis Lam5 = DSM 18033]SHH32526.1 Putative SAM-dependent methyltransferase [Desulforamulus hydrothermalis Lam5 = DSM 18033]
MIQSLVITTGIRRAAELEAKALALSRELNIPYVRRGKQSLAAIRQASGAAAVMLLSCEKLSLVVDDKELFFHPGLAKLRIKEIQSGKTDQMISAMNLQAGDAVLDCTLGLAADALVASYVVGPAGTVVGLEDAAPVASVVRLGLQSYTGEKPEILKAMRRITVIPTDHLTYLKNLPANSFDVVYFDPMFRVAREKSSSMAPLRLFANHNPLSREAVAEAVRVARKRVVMKENRGSDEFKRLNFPAVQGGKYSPVAYGIIEKVVP